MARKPVHGVGFPSLNRHLHTAAEASQLMGSSQINVPVEQLHRRFGIRTQFRPRLHESIQPTTLVEHNIGEVNHLQEQAPESTRWQDGVILGGGAGYTWATGSTAISSPQEFTPGLYSVSIGWQAQNVTNQFYARFVVQTTKNMVVRYSVPLVGYCAATASANNTIGPLEFYAGSNFIVDFKNYGGNVVLPINGCLAFWCTVRKILSGSSLDIGSSMEALREET